MRENQQHKKKKSFGAGPRGPISMLSKYMIGSAASFGFFMCKFCIFYFYTIQNINF
jgi:hypothetical protein